MNDDHILKFDGDPILIPHGPLTDGTKDRVEKAVGLNVPEGAKLAVLAMIDAETGQPIKGSFGVAVRLGEHFKLSAEAEHEFGGPTSAHVGIVAVF